MKREHLFGMEANSRGAVAPTVALSLFALVGAAGIAFDYSRMASLDTELQNAADQAALAAATQLDYEDETCERAVEAARELLVNHTVMANDGSGLPVTIADSGVCGDDTSIVDDVNATVRFFQDKALQIAATDDSEANFVQVTVDARKAEYALTPVVGAFESGDLRASAAAGLSTALCKVPPLMVCPPTGVAVDWDAWRGRGIRAVSNTGASWAPGAFGYIGPSDANSVQIGLAFENPVFQCQSINGTEAVSAGAPTPAIIAINTRFDIYQMSGGAGQALTPCLDSSSSACPPAVNVAKDLVRANNSGSCDINNAGWQLPTNRFRPRIVTGADTTMSRIDADLSIDAMGLPRDTMHYCSSFSTTTGTNCINGVSRFGNGNWARGDYFNKYHAADIAGGLNPSAWTRYETYLWEMANSKIPDDPRTPAAAKGQRGTAVCNMTPPDASRDRRVLQVAVPTNCPSLHGTSVPVQIGTWVDMFLVEPGTSGSNTRRNGDDGNEIYLEVIGESAPGGTRPQVVRRDTPYLIR